MKNKRKVLIAVLLALICGIILASTALIVHNCINDAKNSSDKEWTDSY